SAFNPIKSKQEQTTLYDLLKEMDISTNDKLLLASSFLAEGGDKFIDWHGGVGEITKPISGFAYFGLDTIYNRVDEFIEKGYLDKDFKERIIPERAKNEKGEEVMSARFVNYGDILKAKYAFHQSAKDALEKYIEKENIVLSNKAKDFFSSVGYISGEGNMKKMLQSYKKRGYLKDDKFLEKDFTPESWQKPHEYTMRKIKTSEMLKDEGFFNEEQ